MSRAPREHRLETRDARAKLKARSEPYWRKIFAGTFLGYRKSKSAAAWIARQRRPDGGYAEQRIGAPDDVGTADGDVVLTYKQAVMRAQSVQVEQRRHAPRHYGDGLTLNAVFTGYLEDRKTSPGGRSNRVMPDSTAKMTQQYWDLHLCNGLGKELVTAMDAPALRKWHAALARTAPTVRGKAQDFDLQNPEQARARRASANRVLTIVKAALTHARRAETLPDTLPDFWTRVTPFHLGDDPPPRMLESDEITRLLNAAAPDLRALLTAALMTGARLSELRALRAVDYNGDQGVVRLYQSKTGKTLWQPLTPEGRAFFDRATAGKAPSDALFLHSDGRPWGKSDVTRPMREAAATAKLEDVSFKVSRATYGKLLLLATKDLELVAKALGHSDSRITRKHYAALLPSEVAAGIAKLPSLGIAVDGKVTKMRRRSAKGVR